MARAPGSGRGPREGGEGAGGRGRRSDREGGRGQRRDSGAEREESELVDRLVDINRVSKTVKGGKRFGFAAIVVVGEHGHAVETMISELPTISRLEEMAESAGLVNVNTETASEVFEYENGSEFISSPLVADFLLPAWLDMLDDKEKERVHEELAQLIDAEDGTMSFRFSVKATLLTGEKA